MKPIFKQTAIPPDYSSIFEFDPTKSASGFGQAFHGNTIDALKEAYRDVQMLWESMVPFGPEYPGSGVDSPATRLLLHASMGISCLKLLRPQGRIATERAFAEQRVMLRNALFRHAEAILENLSLTSAFNTLAHSHPFLTCAGFINTLENKIDDRINELINNCNDAPYKKSEAIFIRTSNSERKKIKDDMQQYLKKHRAMYMLRYDVSFFEEISVESYRHKLDLVIERLNHISQNSLLLAIDVIFPRVWNFDIPDVPKGQLILLFKSRQHVKQDLTALPDFLAANGGPAGQSDIQLANTFGRHIKGQGHKRVLSLSNQKDWVLIDEVARFLTVERRLMRLRESSAANGNTTRAPHVIRIKKM